MSRWLFGLLLLSLAATTAAAQRDRDTYNPGNQTFEITGQVNLASTNGPATNVEVRLERFSGGVVDQMSTDGRGRFRFSNLQRGYYKVIINAQGYSPAQQEADLTVVSRSYLVFSLALDKTQSSLPMGAGEIIDARVPAEARQQFEQGRQALAHRNFSDAIASLEKAIATYPSFFEANFLLAKAYVGTRDWAKAEAPLERALELKPENPSVLVSLGEVYWREKRFTDAEQTLLEGVKLDDRSWQGHFALARLYWDMNDVMKAGRQVGLTLQLKSDFAEAHLLAGNVLLKLNQQQRALASYEEYLRLAPKGEFAQQTHELTEKLRKALAAHK